VANTAPMALLEFCARDQLDPVSPRAMVVLDPVRVVLKNYPADKVEVLSAYYFPDKSALKGKPMRTFPFSRIVYIEREDFRVKVCLSVCFLNALDVRAERSRRTSPASSVLRLERLCISSLPTTSRAKASPPTRRGW